MWIIVDLEDIEFQVDRMALDAICSAVSPEMVTTLATKDTTMEASDNIKTMQIGDDKNWYHGYLTMSTRMTKGNVHYDSAHPLEDFGSPRCMARGDASLIGYKYYKLGK
jgi:hypothetical protein